MMEGSLTSEEEEEAKDGLRGFQEVSSHEPALRRRMHNLGCDQDEGRGRAQSFSLNRNLCSERERANSFTHNKSHNYLERVKMRRSQQAVHFVTHYIYFDDTLSLLQVPELFSVVQEEKAALPSSVLSSRPSQEVSPLPSIPSKFSRSASLCGDSPPNFSQFFEVEFSSKV